MKFLSDPHRPPWPFRVLALVVGVGLAYLLLLAGAAGVHFIHLVGEVAAQIAENYTAPAPPPGLAPLPGKEQGVVSVHLLPIEKAKP